MEQTILNWTLAGLLAAGLLIALVNLARRRALVTSGIFALLLAAGLWAALRLPAAALPFTALGIGTLGCGAGVVLARSAAHSAVWMLGCFFSLAGLYLLLGFAFLAMVQILVYAGAIVVLFLFVIMLLDLSRAEAGERDPAPGFLRPGLAGILGALLLTVFLVLGGGAVKEALAAERLAELAERSEAAVSAGAPFGQVLFTRYLLPFEAITMLILAALVGVMVLAPRRPPEEKEGGES